MSKKKVNTKTMARLLAVQVIYQYYLRKQEENLESLTNKMLGFFQSDDFSDDLDTRQKLPEIKISSSFSRNLINLVTENLPIVDDIIAKYLIPGRAIESTLPLVLATLRVAVAELKFVPETPRKVVINEFSDIAQDIIGDFEVGFINYVLDSFVKDELK